MTVSRHSIPKMFFEGLQRLANSRFFSRKEPNLGVWETITWWEARRIPYNLFVGTTGIITCAVCFVTALVCDHFIGDPIGLPNPPGVALFGILAYGIMANVCFTGGWVAELIVQKVWPEEGHAFGKISFFLGLIFSILLTLFPGALVASIGGVRLIGHFLR